MDEIKTEALLGIEALTVLLGKLAASKDPAAGAARVAFESLCETADQITGIHPDGTEFMRP